jgi:hypothetical protein
MGWSTFAVQDEIGLWVFSSETAQGGDARALKSELADVERGLAHGAGEALRAQRKRTADGLRAQLGGVTRVAEQRALMLERMRTTAVGIEGMAVKIGEIGALYDASGQVDTSEDDLRSVSAELDGLRDGLVEAERIVREMLSTTDLRDPPGIPR